MVLRGSEEILQGSVRIHDIRPGSTGFSRVPAGSNTVLMGLQGKAPGDFIGFPRVFHAVLSVGSHRVPTGFFQVQEDL